MELPDAQAIAACEKIGAMLLERDGKMYKQSKGIMSQCVFLE